MRIVLDTNVVVSALLWRGTPYRLRDAIRQYESDKHDCGAALFDSSSFSLTRKICTAKYFPVSVAFSPNGKRSAIGSNKLVTIVEAVE